MRPTLLRQLTLQRVHQAKLSTKAHFKRLLAIANKTIEEKNLVTHKSVKVPNSLMDFINQQSSKRIETLGKLRMSAYYTKDSNDFSKIHPLISEAIEEGKIPSSDLEELQQALELYNSGLLDAITFNFESQPPPKIKSVQTDILNLLKEESIQTKEQIPKMVFLEWFSSFCGEKIVQINNIDFEKRNPYLTAHSEDKLSKTGEIVKEIQSNIVLCHEGNGTMKTFLISGEYIFSKLDDYSQEILSSPIFYFKNKAVDENPSLKPTLNLFPIFLQIDGNIEINFDLLREFDFFSNKFPEKDVINSLEKLAKITKEAEKDCFKTGLVGNPEEGKAQALKFSQRKTMHGRMHENKNTILPKPLSQYTGIDKSRKGLAMILEEDPSKSPSRTKGRIISQTDFIKTRE